MGKASRQASMEPPEGEKFLAIGDVAHLVNEAQALGIRWDALVTAKVGVGGRIKHMEVRDLVPAGEEDWEEPLQPPQEQPALPAGNGEGPWPPPLDGESHEGWQPPAGEASEWPPGSIQDTVTGEALLPPPQARPVAVGARHRK
jgi:hypothetical protein